MTAKFPRRAVDVLNIPRVKDFGNVLVLHGHSVQSVRLGWRGRWFVRCAVVVCWRYPQSLGTSPTDYEGDLRIPEIRSLHSDNCKPRLELQVVSRKRCSCSLIYTVCVKLQTKMPRQSGREKWVVYVCPHRTKKAERNEPEKFPSCLMVVDDAMTLHVACLNARLRGLRRN
jgi:hypothetical protein